MRIVSRYKSITGNGYVFEDGDLNDLRRAGLNKDGTDRFCFNGSHYYIGMESMRAVDEGTEATINTLDAELERLRKRAFELRKERRTLLEKGFNKFKKVYKWDVEAVPAEGK